MISQKLFTILSGLALSSVLSATVTTSASATERFSVNDWGKSFATALQKKDIKKASQLADLQSLEKTAVPKCVDCDTNTKMKKARALFAKGKFSEAIDLYNEIPKGSDYWLQAVEERGWAHFRAEDLEKALAQTKTLLSPQFVGVIDSEAFLLQSLSQLRLCDYQGVLETDQKFKESQKARIVEMQDLMKTGTSAELEKALAKVDKFPLEFTDFGDSLPHLPLLFYRDLEIQKELLKLKISDKALATAEIAAQVSLKSQMQKWNKESRANIKNRIKELAQKQNDENFSIVQKINLVEVEAIQRIHTDIEMSKDLYKKNEFKKTSDDQLVFMDDGHPWMDELDKYEVAAKACSKSIRRKM